MHETGPAEGFGRVRGIFCLGAAISVSILTLDCAKESGLVVFKSRVEHIMFNMVGAWKAYSSTEEWPVQFPSVLESRSMTKFKAKVL